MQLDPMCDLAVTKFPNMGHRRCKELYRPRHWKSAGAVIVQHFYEFAARRHRTRGMPSDKENVRALKTMLQCISIKKPRLPVSNLTTVVPSRMFEHFHYGGFQRIACLRPKCQTSGFPSAARNASTDSIYKEFLGTMN